MNCADDSVDRQVPVLGDGGGLETPDDEDGQLATDPQESRPLTMRAEYDAHNALVRGLGWYVSQLSHAIAGRSVAITRVTTDWADHDDGQVESPSAAVFSTEIGQYETNSGMAPGTPRKVDKSFDANDKITVQSLTCSGMYKLTELTVNVWCEDKIQRAGVRQMLVDGFWPVTWMSGFRLFLPRYHSAVAEYLLLSAQQGDASGSATIGLWPLSMRLTARVPVYRAHRLVLARPAAVGTIGLGNRRT
jgi:hypothetical protein